MALKKASGAGRKPGDKVNIRLNRKVVASGHNLEVITRYNREKSSIKAMRISKVEKGEGDLTVEFDNGAKSTTRFADYSVLEDWSGKKSRRFGFPVTRGKEVIHKG